MVTFHDQYMCAIFPQSGQLSGPKSQVKLIILDSLTLLPYMPAAGLGCYGNIV